MRCCRCEPCWESCLEAADGGGAVERLGEPCVDRAARQAAQAPDLPAAAPVEALHHACGGNGNMLEDLQ